MGKEGITDAANNFPFMLKDVWKSSWVRVPGFPTGANGCFIELYFTAAVQSGAKYQQDHPCYQLAVPVEFWASVKNVLTLRDAEFAAGETDSMHSDSSSVLAGKLDPVTAQDAVYTVRDRQTKLNFAWCATAGIAPRVMTSVFVKTYNYARVSCGLGRLKIIPIKSSNPELATEAFILPQIDKHAKLNGAQPSYVEGHSMAFGYQLNEKDCVRLQGNDLRQAVWALDGMIVQKLAAGGNTGQLNQLRSDLQSQILEGSGTFEQIRSRLTALKNTAASLGVIGLTKLERDAGVSLTHPNNQGTGQPQ